MLSSVLPKDEGQSLLYEGTRKGLDAGKQLMSADKVLSIRLASGTSSWKRERQRPFVEEASKLQSEFGGAFSKYMEAQHCATSSSGVDHSRGRTEFTDAHDFEADDFARSCASTVKDAPGRAKRITAANFHWPLALKRSAKQRDLAPVVSLRGAMALPPLDGDARYHWREYRGIGATERGLLDRTPRTDPDCTRPLPRVRSKSPPSAPRSPKANFDEKKLWTPFFGTPSMGLAHSGSSTARLIASKTDQHEQEGDFFVQSSRLFDPLEASEGFSWKCAPAPWPESISVPLKTRGAEIPRF